jgi:hypothetical protein
MVGVVLDEFLIRPIKKGRPVPGRRKRTALSTPAEQGTRHLTRSPKDAPER